MFRYIQRLAYGRKKLLRQFRLSNVFNICFSLWSVWVFCTKPVLVLTASELRCMHAMHALAQMLAAFNNFHQWTVFTNKRYITEIFLDLFVVQSEPRISTFYEYAALCFLSPNEGVDGFIILEFTVGCFLWNASLNIPFTVTSYSGTLGKYPARNEPSKRKLWIKPSGSVCLLRQQTHTYGKYTWLLPALVPTPLLRSGPIRPPEDRTEKTFNKTDTQNTYATPDWRLLPAARRAARDICTRASVKKTPCVSLSEPTNPCSALWRRCHRPRKTFEKSARFQTLRSLPRLIFSFAPVIRSKLFQEGQG